jgi:penicillin-binding protein 2
MGYDLPTGKRGKIPTSKTYKKLYPGWLKWDGKTIVSNAIGQGEVLMTPIQLANLMATVANKGYYYTPHIVKKIKGEILDQKFRTKHVTSIERKYFDPVIQGMFDVYNHGTARGLGVVGIDICGKTGTAENYLKVNGKKVKLQDHSIFVAFAPKDNPKIAIAVFVENGYWGSRWAGPITALMIEKYLKRKITKVDFEKRMLQGSLKGEYDKLYPKKHQDSISIINNKLKDSLVKIKRTKDSINGSKTNVVKIDSIKNP